MSVRLPVGVLVMAYGGPASLDEIPGYLADIRSGRPTPRHVLEEITENYRAIGGSSPLLEVTRRQVDAIEDRLGDLVNLLGASAVKDLVAQGKTNVAFAGGIAEASATAVSSSRGFGSPVNGPEFELQGNYSTELCEIPNDPDSPLVDGEPIPPGIGDETSPEVSSVQASEITSTSAAIQWLTDEGATGQVQYGIGGTGTSSAVDEDLTTFHRIVLTGLLPYKYYTFKVRSADGNGNLTVSGTAMFRTLR